MIAPFLKERSGWTVPTCVGGAERAGRAGSISLKECTAWTKEIRELWTVVGKASGERELTRDPFKSRKGFGFRVRQARVRPSNTSIRDLLSNSRYTEAVLRFLEETKVGEVKAGAIYI